jgi:glycosyltransferase involved in cell wall biosynthesis
MALDHAELWLIGGGQPPGDLPAGVVVQGPVAQSRIPALLSECDVFTLPSIADGFGLVVLQAMACELPVVVSDQCGAAGAVRDQSYARVVAAGDALALASALESFARLDRDQCRELGRAARRDAVARFSWRAHVERLTWAPRAQGSFAA